ncbi:MAG: HAMP domain-containing sensor histidine kinase [Bacillota bacterium]|nr:HAMP domain-containing sensor histidine kinase [Bacillota bacterium]
MAESLNILSRKLDTSLKDLQEANEQLLEDMEKERQQELKRKEFVASVSHELKTPLGIIKGFAEGIKDGIHQNKQDYYLDVIINEIETMDDLVMEMLELSRFELGNYKLSRQEFAMDSLVMEFNQRFRYLIDERHLKTHFDIEECNVLADREKIEKVLNNLYSNAIRYSINEGSINIKLKKQKNNMICYSIENTGVHIPEDELDKIWDRFYRIEKSRNRVSGGTGLGLLIVKNILQMHESDFGAINTDKGVEFYFSLPEA